MMDTTVLLGVLGVSVFTDLTKHKIYNRVCLFALIAGIGLHWGVNEFWQPIAGILAGFIIFLPFYLLKGMSAGDVKLIASCGAILGWPYAIIGAALSLMAGTIVGLFVYCIRGGIKEAFSRYGFAAICFVRTGKIILPDAPENSVSKSRFPYAIAIAIGCLLTQMLKIA